jgi:hypothetical protein
MPKGFDTTQNVAAKAPAIENYGAIPPGMRIA